MTGCASSSLMSKLTEPLPLAPASRPVPEAAFNVGRLTVTDSESPSSRLSPFARRTTVALVALGVAAPVKVTVGGSLMGSVLPRLA